MKQIIRLLPLVLMVALTTVSCQKKEESSFTEADLIGKWQCASTLGAGNEVWVYLAEKDSADASYRWGKTWDEGDDVHESDVDKEKHGNGWFKWKIEQTNLTQIHMMSVSEASVPKVYTVVTLNNTTLTLRDDFKKEKTYTRVN